MQQSEAQALESVRSRLTKRFPELGEETVASAVSAASSEMTGPIRDYVPILVEHNARERLTRQQGHRPEPIASLDRNG
ncbi:three-helix bundle dimerization domain-containing protein [Sinomonas sp. G460-2]|uniref:three-helix bundle dimerization domain-containing protein n=1 Tax=Sinomonas sp. G460-2 TaxID=3393464 RepID=UPI0039F0A871